MDELKRIDVKDLPSPSELERLRKIDVKDLPSPSELEKYREKKDQPKDERFIGGKLGDYIYNAGDAVSDFVSGPVSAFATNVGRQFPFVGGYVDNINAAIEPLVDKLTPKDTRIEALEKQGHTFPEDTRTFAQRRDSFKRQQQKLDEENPISAKIGTGLGFAASLGLPALKMAEAPTLAAKAAQGAKFGALYGALANPGDVEGEVTPVQPLERAKNALIGGAFGGAIPYVAGKIPQYLSNKAEAKAFKSLGLPTKAQLTKLGEKGDDKRIGRMLLDEAGLSAHDSKEEILEKIIKLNDQKQDKVDALIKEFGDLSESPEFIAKLPEKDKLAVKASKFRPFEKVEEIKNDLINKYGKENKSRLSGAFGALDEYAENYKPLVEGGQSQAISLAEANAQKRRLNNLIKDSSYNKDFSANPITTQADMIRQGKLRQSVEDQTDLVSKLLGKDTGQIKSTNKDISNLIEAEKLAKDAIVRQKKNQEFGLTEGVYGSGGAMVGAKIGAMFGPIGAGAGAVIGGLAGGLGRNLQKKYGAQAAAVSYDAISKTLQKNAGAFSKLGPQQQQILIERMYKRVNNGANPQDALPVSEDDAVEAFKNSD